MQEGEVPGLDAFDETRMRAIEVSTALDITLDDLLGHYAVLRRDFPEMGAMPLTVDDSTVAFLQELDIPEAGAIIIGLIQYIYDHWTDAERQHIATEHVCGEREES